VLVWALTALPRFFTPTEARAVKSRKDRAKEELKKDLLIWDFALTEKLVMQAKFTK
jgi:hypothetical protein